MTAIPPVSPLLQEIASQASEAELLNGEQFTFEGNDYAGVGSDMPISISLGLTGYAENSKKVLQATCAQFSQDDLDRFAAVPLESRLVLTYLGRTWKVISMENDGLHLKFGIITAGT